MYEEWIKQQSTKIVRPKVLRYSLIIEVKPKKIIFKNLRNRWGSATRDGTLNFSFNLVKAPEDVIDYVIIHELCHLRIKEHSHHYWNLVNQYCSDYKRKIEWLEINGTVALEHQKTTSDKISSELRATGPSFVIKEQIRK